MPWAALRDSISIGEFSILPWSEYSECTDPPNFRKGLLDTISRYRKNATTAEDSAAVIVRKVGRLEPFTEDEKAEIRDVVNIVAFSCFIDNWGPLARTAENFEYVFLQIPEQILSEGFAYEVGSLLRAKVIVSTGVEQLFHAPDYLQVPMASKPNGTTLFLLAEAYERLSDKDLRARVLRALEFIRIAHANSPTFDERTRIVLLCVAFETVFLGDKGGSKAVPLAREIDELIGKTLRKSHRPNEKESHTRYGWWLRDLYRLRNKIMHGDAVDKDDFFHLYARERTTKFLVGLELFAHSLDEGLLRAGIHLEEEIRSLLRIGLGQFFEDPI